MAEMDRTLDQPVEVDAFAGVAAYSRFHFQRLFSAFLGLGVAEYRRLSRLKRAGHQLAYRNEIPVTDIAYDAGYENLESFSRAFKRCFGQNPSDFRRAPDWTTWHQTYAPLTELKGQLMPVDNDEPNHIRIVDFPETQVAALEHIGPQSGLTATVQRFIAWRREHGSPPAESATFNILYDDPRTTDPEGFRFDFCCSVQGPVSANDFGIVPKTIPAGRCAVVRHVGSLDFAEDKIRSLYRDWLPSSGEDLRDFPLFVQRLSFYPDVPEHEAQADIFLPLK